MIDEQLIEKLATLSRLEVSPEERAEFRSEIEAILGYVSEIQTAVSNTAGVADASGVPKAHADLVAHKNVFREDGKPHAGGAFTEAILHNAPRAENGYLKVKKILKGE